MFVKIDKGGISGWNKCLCLISGGNKPFGQQAQTKDAGRICRPEASSGTGEDVEDANRIGSVGLMKELHYGEGYEYAHNTEEKVTRMQCLPDALMGRRYYHPTNQGKEDEICKRIKSIREWKKGY